MSLHIQTHNEGDKKNNFQLDKFIGGESNKLGIIINKRERGVSHEGRVVGKNKEEQ